VFLSLVGRLFLCYSLGFHQYLLGFLWHWALEDYLFRLCFNADFNAFAFLLFQDYFVLTEESPPQNHVEDPPFFEIFSIHCISASTKDLFGSMILGSYLFPLFEFNSFAFCPPPPRFASVIVELSPFQICS